MKTTRKSRRIAIDVSNAYSVSRANFLSKKKKNPNNYGYKIMEKANFGPLIFAKWVGQAHKYNKYRSALLFFFFF